MSDQDHRSGARPIALIGLRGSGKSEVAREIAALLGADCLDTDELIVRRAGKSIHRIFAEDGEREFRRLEREAVATAFGDNPSVIALGGGAVLDPLTADTLTERATVVWLTAPEDVLHERIMADPATATNRPALTPEDGLAELGLLSARRSETYRQLADLTLDTSQRTPAAIARDILRRLGDRDP